jgi:ABC-2 type transport system permease protein
MMLWGFMTRYLNSVANTQFNFIPALLGAVVFWDFFIRVMQGVTLAFFEDVWARNFLNIFASPLSTVEYVTGLVISSIVTSSVGAIVMVLIATLVFGLSFTVYGLLILPFVLVLFLFGIALGVAACAMVLRLGPAAEWFVWPIPAIISPFVAVLYPLNTLPEWMRWISSALPPSYVFESLRAVLNGQPVHSQSLAISTALALLDLFLACWLFVAVYRGAVRSGLIARYSAESTS